MTATRPAGFLRRHAAAIRLGLLVLAVGALLATARAFPPSRTFEALRERLDGLGPLGPVAFGAAYVAAVVLMLPGSVLTIAAGALFGLLVGTVTASIASTTGAALAFLIARSAARDAVARRLARSPRFARLDRAIARDGWRVVALLRLSPLVPFNVQNYLYGLTGIGFGPYLLASWSAMLPGTVLHVYLGTLARLGLDAFGGSGRPRSPLEWALLVVGLLATIAATVTVARLARRALRERGDLDADAPATARADDPATGNRGRASET